MKKTLGELTAAEFINLVCGDTSVLLSKREIPNPAELAIAMRDIVLEYREIADPGSMMSYFSLIEQLVKARIGMLIFSMCSDLMQLERIEDVKAILSDYGLSVARMNKKRLSQEIRSRMERLKLEVTRLESENQENAPEVAEIRRAFDSQTASMMAHFKFQIDIRTMQATIYAHLTARFTSEIKAMQRAMKKK